MKIKEWVTVKSPTMATLDGIMFEVIKDNSSIQSIEMTDKFGTKLRISRDPYGAGISILVPSPPKMKKIYRLHGKFLGVAEFKEDFDDDCDAQTRRNELLKKAEYDEVALGLKVEPLEIPEESEEV